MSRARQLAVVLLVCLGVVACGGDPDPQPDVIEWRNITMDVPDGWWLIERSDTHLTLSNANLAVEREADEPFDPPEEGVVRLALTFEPGTQPDDWRRFVEQQDATLESDARLTLGERTPATQLLFSYTTNNIATREMVVLIPSRQVVALAQPVPGPDGNAPEIFLDHIETFLEVLETAEFGPPVLESAPEE